METALLYFIIAVVTSVSVLSIVKKVFEIKDFVTVDYVFVVFVTTVVLYLADYTSIVQID